MNANLDNLFQFQPQLEADESGTPRQFSGVCYSGGLIPSYGWFGNAAIDLSTLKAPTKALFALVNHDPDQRAGRCEIQAGATAVAIQGKFLKNTAGQTVAAEFADGAPWEFSVGINATPKVFEKPTTVEVNGRLLTLDTLFVDAMVREVSFVPAGADPNTHAIAFAAKEAVMTETNLVELTRRVAETEQQLAESAEALEATSNNLAGMELELNETKVKATVAEAELAAHKLELDVAKTELEAAREEIQRLEGLLEEAKAEKRFEAVKSLFADIGREFSDEMARNYMKLSEDTFSLLAADLRFVAGKRTDETLFTEQATSGCATDPMSKIDLLAAELRKADPSLTQPMAVAKVLRQNPSLYTETLGA